MSCLAHRLQQLGAGHRRRDGDAGGAALRQRHRHLALGLGPHLHHTLRDSHQVRGHKYGGVLEAQGRPNGGGCRRRLLPLVDAERTPQRALGAALYICVDSCKQLKEFTAACTREQPHRPRSQPRSDGPSLAGSLEHTLTLRAYMLQRNFVI
jgi:hypothetical protein